jgi:DNA-binding MarR family transcriptional regulator/N-acetylglutamate synthase-like GNAT family acetyltransferase
MEEDQVIAAIRRFNRQYTKRTGLLDSALLQHGFTPAEIRVLWEIAHKDHISAGEIRHELGMDAAVVSRLVAALKAKGVVRTEVFPHDRRIRNLRLTPLGKRTVAVLERESSEHVANMIGFVSHAGREKLVASLREVETLLDAPFERPWQLVIRDPAPGDLGWVVSRHGALYDASFEGLVAGIVADYVRNHKPRREKCWIAEKDGERVGCVFLVEKSKSVGQLRLLLVEPSARGSGIGTRLVQECIGGARAAGYSKLVLWTQANLHAAHRIFKAAGFRLVSQEKQYWELDLRAPAK